MNMEQWNNDGLQAPGVTLLLLKVFVSNTERSYRSTRAAPLSTPDAVK
jgi:hypothetical protein